jgi:lipase maturation factor 1
MDWMAKIRWLFNPAFGPSDRALPRWLFLRALGCVYFSAFFSLVFQIRGLIGPHGILPADQYLKAIANSLGKVGRVWFAPTLLWLSSGPHMLIAMCWIGMIASLLLVLNIWPRGMLVICFICFLSFVSAAQDFAGYQSDGMLLEAGFIALLFAPSGFRPGFGVSSPFSRISLFLLQWEWFRIYFESGAAKILGGDPEWRNFTAMDEYYQNGPLPTWIGWYAQHLPHWFHAATVFITLAVELVLVWMLFLPRRWRIVCFFIVTFLQIGIILTANYTFLNYLVLILGFLLLDDRFLLHWVPQKWKAIFSLLPVNSPTEVAEPVRVKSESNLRWRIRVVKLSLASIVLGWVFYATFAQLVWMFYPLPMPTSLVAALEPFRIANRYGLFGVMTRGRYEIEFQGSNDGETWIAYPFRFKPQDMNKAPGIYAPYQPRFDWNLWFASLGSWRQYPIVPNTEILLLSNDKDVLSLFAGNPFPNGPPLQVRAVIWQYWFTTIPEKRTQGLWWRRQFIGLYAPAIEREADGKFRVIQWPTADTRD